MHFSSILFFIVDDIFLRQRKHDRVGLYLVVTLNALQGFTATVNALFMLLFVLSNVRPAFTAT